MRSARLRRRRAHAQPAIRFALAAVVLVSSGTAAGVAGYLTAATDAGARTTLASATDPPLAFEVSSTGGDAAQVDAALADQLAALEVPVELHRSQISGSRVVFPGSSGPPRSEEGASGEAVDDDGLGHLVLAAYQDLADHAELAAGTWPGTVRTDSTFPVAIHADPAARLGITVGDAISFADRDEVVVLEVVGLWRPLDAGSPFWFEDREADGAGGSTDLIGITSNAGLEAVPGLTLTNRWRLVPDIDRLQARDVVTLQTVLPRLLPQLERDDRTDGARLEANSGLLDLLRDSEDKLRAAQSVTAAPLLLFGLAAMLAVALVGRLLVVARGAERSVYRARGVSATQGLLWSLAETLPVVLLSSIAGAAGAWFVLYLVSGTTAAPTVLAAAAGAVAAVTVVTLLAIGTRPALAPASMPFRPRAEGGRRAQLVPAVTAVLVMVLAAVTMWQLLRYGGPAVENARGDSSIDPLAVLAPVAALAASGLLVAAGVALAARAGQGLLARRRTLGSVLAMRSVARRPAAYSVPITLVVLAAGGGTLAAGLSGTWTDLQRDAAVQRTGADLQVVLAPRPATAATPPDGAALEPYRQISGTMSVTPVLAGWVPLAGGQVQLAGFQGDRLRLDGAKLPSDAHSVELVFTATMSAHELDYGDMALSSERPDQPTAGVVGIQLLLADADGLVTAVRADEFAIPASATPSRHEVRAALPAGTAPWTLAGFEMSIGGQRSSGPVWWANDYAITLAEIHSISEDVAHEVWRPADWSIGFAGEPPRVAGDELAVEQAGSAAGVVVTSGGVPYPSFDVRVLAGEWSIGGGEGAPIAVHATESALDQSGLAIGDQAAVRVAGAEMVIEVAGIAAAVAGMTTDEVLVADLGDITMAALALAGPVPRANQVWIEASGTALANGGLADSVRSVAGPRAEVVDRFALEDALRSNAFARMSLVTYWVVAGAVVLLAGIGLAAAAAALVRERSDEVGTLRTLGASAKLQARLGRREQLVMSVLALALGAGAGGLVTVLVAGLLAGAATPVELYGVEPALRLQVLPWAAVLTALGALAVAVAVIYGERLRRRASDLPARRFST